MSASQREVRQAFADAVHDLAAEPTGRNVLRYLLASRELERPHDADVASRSPSPDKKTKAPRLRAFQKGSTRSETRKAA